MNARLLVWCLILGGCSRGVGGLQIAAVPNGGVLDATHRVTFTSLYSFQSSSDGNTPTADLIDVAGTLYGTTNYGGSQGDGTVFEITTSGNENVLHTFTGSDGAVPQAGLADVNGTFYGTTDGGGASGDGTVFSLSL
jgi:uncharacterized repeat protein (TIGR03803 family)